ncbi:MAG: hypothetical protein Q9227_003382 [Pyrenula ochraceoflavens]
MRSLNTSLPSSNISSARLHSERPPEQLLQSFKNAALSVTNLYKQAASDRSSARLAGYQDALDDLLTFLDQENLGLGDGEGWKVRQWATERYDGTSHGTIAGDSDDDRQDGGGTKATTPSRTDRQASQDSDGRNLSPSPLDQTPATTKNEPLVEEVTNAPVFTFTAAPNLPILDVDMQSTEQTQSRSHTGSETSTNASNRVPSIIRGPKGSYRHGNLRHGSRSSASRESTSIIGAKRKFQFSDFFDISNVPGNGRDGSVGKRGKFTQ